jgi:excisionase family DNA binding protein
MTIYTVKQAAKELGISPALVYALVAAGEIEHERHGLGRGCIRITEEALRRYRESRTRCKASAPGPVPRAAERTGKHIL